jgi:diaminopimelate decarboxylase
MHCFKEIFMSDKTLPFTKASLSPILREVPTPFHIYDEAAIRKNAQNFYKAFSWVPGGFKNYYAVKALPNPHILDIIKEEGMGADCSSYGELVLSEAVGFQGEDIMFTSNDTPAYEYQKAKDLGAVINLDDITHIDFLEKEVGLPELLCFRFNPGPLKGGNAIIGSPEDAKYGFTAEQVLEGYRKAKQKGVSRFALHTMVASNELNVDYFVETARILFELAAKVIKEIGLDLDFINLGGGIGIPYKPEDNAPDLFAMSEGIKKAYDELIRPTGNTPKIVMECGRMVTGPYGYLVSKVLHKKSIYKDYVGLDSSMANLMRPGMYGAYHHVTVLDKETAPASQTVDVTGSLCENNDKFAIDRTLPEIDIDDIVVIHDTGAHGHSMGFNYNAKLRSSEVLLKADGGFKVIRRAETLDDYFATLDYPGLKK